MELRRASQLAGGASVPTRSPPSAGQNAREADGGPGEGPAFLPAGGSGRGAGAVACRRVRDRAHPRGGPARVLVDAGATGPGAGRAAHSGRRSRHGRRARVAGPALRTPAARGRPRVHAGSLDHARSVLRRGSLRCGRAAGPDGLRAHRAARARARRQLGSGVEDHRDRCPGRRGHRSLPTVPPVPLEQGSPGGRHRLRRSSTCLERARHRERAGDRDARRPALRLRPGRQGNRPRAFHARIGGRIDVRLLGQGHTRGDRPLRSAARRSRRSRPAGLDRSWCRDRGGSRHMPSRG